MNAPSRPSGGIAESIGARQVSWLAAYRRRRLPGLMKKPSGEKRRHAAHSRGGGLGSAKSLPCSLFTLGRNRGTVRRSCSSFGRGCQIECGTLVRAAELEKLAAHGSGLTSGEALSIENRLACTLAGSSCNSLGGEPRGPNQVLSSHNAVVLASAKMRLGTGAMYSSSPGSLAAPNSISSKRRSISYWSRATASRVAAHAGADWAEVQYLALFLIRLDARTTAGAQTATEKKPRRN
jgi:hypothetical protein